MNVLITGGTGLIGRRLCAALNARGHTVIVLSRRPQQVAALCGAQVQAWDSLQRWSPHTQIDAVINLAGAPILDRRWTPARKRELIESRVTLTQSLVQAMQRAAVPPRVLLSGSAIGIYADTGARECDENAPLGHDFAAQLCTAWEAAARDAERLGTRVVTLRTGLVQAADGGMLARLLLPFRLGLGARLGNGRQWMSWIHIDDYIRLTLELLQDAGAQGPFNLTAPTPVTNADFTRRLARTLRRPAPWWVPAPLLRLLVGEGATLLLSSQRIVPRRLLARGARFEFPGLPDALGDLLAR